MTAATRLQIQTALGRDVLKTAEVIQFHLSSYGKCDAACGGSSFKSFMMALAMKR